MRREEGLTLLETVVALFLIGIGLVVVLPLFVYSSRNNLVGWEYTQLTHLAVEHMERLRELDYRSPELAAGGSLAANVTNEVAYFDESNADAVVRWEVADDVSTAGTKTIHVRALSRRQIVGLRKEVVLAVVRGPS